MALVNNIAIIALYIRPPVSWRITLSDKMKFTDY